MTFEQIVERYNAGSKDLSGPTLFILNDPAQGVNAAQDFARALDEAIGSEPYNQVMGIIEKWISEKAAPQFNERAAVQGEMYKQAINQRRNALMDENREIADSVQRYKAGAPQGLVNENQAPLLENVKQPLRPQKAAPQGETVKSAPGHNKALIIAAALVFIGLLYYFSKK